MSALWNYGNTLFVILLGLVLTPYQLAKLGVEAYGVIMLELTLVSLATLVNTTLVKAMVVVGARKDAAIWTSTGQLARWSGFLVWSASGLTAWLILPRLNIPAPLLREAQGLLVILGFSQSLNIFVATSQARLMLGQRFDLLNKALIVGQIVQCASLVILFEAFHPSLMLNGLAVLAGAIVSRFLIWLYTNARLAPFESRQPVTALRLREFLGIWSLLAGMQIAAVFSNQALQLAANYFGGPVANAVIGLLMVIRGAVGRLNDGLASAVFSALATVFPHDPAETRRLWLLSTRGVALLSLPFVLACALVPGAVATVWLGQNGVVVAEWLPLVALDIGVPVLALITVQLLQLGQRRTLLLMFDVGLMAAIIVSVIWLGLTGRAEAGQLFLAYAGLRSLYGLVLLFGVGPREAFSHAGEIWKAVIGPVMACGVPAAAVLWALRTTGLGGGSHLGLALMALATGAVFLPMVWWVGLDEELRGKLRKRFTTGGTHGRA
jgi:O-antigen/teichoic acid export membrane protein